MTPIMSEPGLSKVELNAGELTGRRLVSYRIRDLSQVYEINIPSPPMRPLSKPMSIKPKEVKTLTVKMSDRPCSSTAPMVVYG
jgi:hypothetical protein